MCECVWGGGAVNSCVRNLGDGLKAPALWAPKSEGERKGSGCVGVGEVEPTLSQWSIARSSLRSPLLTPIPHAAHPPPTFLPFPVKPGLLGSLAPGVFGSFLTLCHIYPVAAVCPPSAGHHVSLLFRKNIILTKPHWFLSPSTVIWLCCYVVTQFICLADFLIQTENS